MPDLDLIKQVEQGVRDRRRPSAEAGRAMPRGGGAAAATTSTAPADPHNLARFFVIELQSICRPSFTIPA
jgi:hypothetical protein